MQAHHCVITHSLRTNDAVKAGATLSDRPQVYRPVLILASRLLLLGPTQAAMHGFSPPSEHVCGRTRFHLWLEGAVDCPVRGDFVSRLPDIRGEPGKVSGAKRSRFLDLRPEHRYAQDVRLELHE